jgi:hypothetical protein
MSYLEKSTVFYGLRRARFEGALAKKPSALPEDTLFPVKRFQDFV